MSNNFYEYLLYSSPYWRKRYSEVPDIILNKIYPATELHNVRGPIHLEKDIFPTLQDFLIFFPSVKNTIHLIVELQPQTSIKKEKEKVHSLNRNTIIKKEGEKNKKNLSLNPPPMIQNQALIRSPTNTVEVLLKLQHLSLNLLYLHLFVHTHRLEKKVI